MEVCWTPARSGAWVAPELGVLRDAACGPAPAWHAAAAAAADAAAEEVEARARDSPLALALVAAAGVPLLSLPQGVAELMTKHMVRHPAQRLGGRVAGLVSVQRGAWGRGRVVQAMPCTPTGEQVLGRLNAFSLHPAGTCPAREGRSTYDCLHLPPSARHVHWSLLRHVFRPVRARALRLQVAKPRVCSPLLARQALGPVAAAGAAGAAAAAAAAALAPHLPDAALLPHLPPLLDYCLADLHPDQHPALTGKRRYPHACL